MRPAPDIYLTRTATRCTEVVTEMGELAYPTSVHYLPHTYRNIKLGLWSPAQRLVEELVQEIGRETAPDLSPDAQGFILAAGNTVFAGTRLRPESEGGRLGYELKAKTMLTTQMMAGRVAQSLGAVGHIATDASACASSMKALMDAYHLMALHGFERVAVLAVEDPLNLGMLDFFGAMAVCLSQKALQQGIRPSAFDAINQGFLLGQGAALVWLETAHSLRKTGHTPVARLAASVTAGEAFQNPVGQDALGGGYERAIRWALNVAACEPASIDLIKTHGTGTVVNNRAEAAALHRVFGHSFLATAYKPSIGHTFGASGLLESVLAIQDARALRVRGIANRTSRDANFTDQAVSCKVNRILSLSAGMGNVYGAAIWEVLHTH